MPRFTVVWLGFFVYKCYAKNIHPAKPEIADFLSSALQKSAQSINKVHAMFQFSMVQIMFAPLAPLEEISSMSLI